MLQGVTTHPSLRDASANTAEIPKGLVGSMLGDCPWMPADAVSGISLAVGFLAPLVEVATCIMGGT